MMNLSYWEIKSWLNNIDFAIIGSGIVGLCCALSLRKKFPEAKIVVFEKKSEAWLIEYLDEKSPIETW